MQRTRLAMPAAMIVSLAASQASVAVTITWTGGAGTTSWHTPANWNLNRVPEAGDDVVIPNMTPDVNVTYSSGSTTINSLTSTEAFTLSGGTLTINSPSTVNSAFTFTGTLSGTGDVTVNGAMTWTGSGTMTGTGKTIISPTASLAISDPFTKNLQRTLENHSANTSWTPGVGSSLNFNNGTLINAADGTFTANLTANNTIYNFTSAGGVNAVSNAGTFNKIGGGILTFNTFTTPMPFNNSGTTNLDAGGMNISSGGSNTGTIDADAGSTLTMSSTVSLDPSSALTGQGTLTFTGGSPNTVTCTLSTNRVINIQSTVNFNAPYTMTGAVNLGGTLSGSGDITIAGPMNWTGTGTMSGTGKTIIAPTGSLAISDIFTKFLSRTLENNSANATWTPGVGSSFNFNNGMLKNQPGGTLTMNLAGPANLGSSGGTNAINNLGTFIKTGAGLLSISSISFDNSGTVNLDGGGLAISGGGTNTGTMDADAGTGLTFNAGFTHDASSSLIGQGTLSFFGAGSHTISGILSTNRTININAAVNFNAPYTFSGILNLANTLGGSGDVTITGTMNWTGTGAMAGTGKTIVAAGANLTISDTFTKGLHRLLENHSTNSNWTGGSISLNNGTLSNESGGAFTANTATFINVTAVGTSSFTNAGMFNKAGAGNCVVSDIPLTNTGTLNVQAGVLSLQGGLTNFSGTTLTGGTYNVAAILRFANANIITSAANIILDGPASTIQNNSGGAGLANFATNTAAGAFQIKNGRNFALTGAFTNAGLVTIGPGDNTFSASTFSNSGTITKPAAGTGSINSTITQTGGGTIDVLGGTLTLTTLTNFSGTTLSGGTYKAAGTLRFGNANIANNAAIIILDGPTSAVENTLGVNALANLATNAAAGAIQIKNGRNLALSGDFGNAGQVTIGPGDNTLSLPGNYVQSAGLTQLDGGTLDPADFADFQSGELKGNGSVLGNVTNSGTCRPGLSPGGISITGNYTQTIAGTFEAEVGGTTAVTDYDQLSVTGQSILLGTLRILLINGFAPSINDVFDIVTAATISTKFGTIQLPMLPSLKGFELEPTATALRLNVVDCGPGDADGDGVGDACDTIPDLSWYTIDGGGRTFSSGGVFRVGATIGQPDAGSFTAPLTGGGFTLVSGFWPGNEVTEDPTCPLLGDMNTDGQRNGIDIQNFVGCVLGSGGSECSCADMNESGAVDTADVAPFVQLLLN